MPPKRKNRATTKTAAAATPSKQQQAAGAIRTSLVKRRRSSVQGGKSSTSRLQPSEPLHMTTRGAAKAASNHTSPAGPSPVDGPSRRTSINGIANLQDDHSDSDDAQAKRSRELTDSGSPPKQMGSSLSQLQALETEANPASRTLSKPQKVAGKKRRAPADSSSEATKTASALANGSTLVTRSESDLSEKTPRRKKRKTADAPQDPTDAPPELTDASTPPGSPEAIPGVDVAPSHALQNVLPSVNGEMPAKAAKRLPGRRRQPHSNVNVETNLRRQLELKMNYRSLAKVQKTILEELSKRTLENLKNDPEFHKQTPEYDNVMGELDQRFQSRMNQLNSERQLKLDQLERVTIAEKHIQEQQFINRFREFQDNFILQAMYRMKQLERRLKAERGDITDDEEQIVEPTHMQFPTEGKDDRLGSIYASRSRAYVETERMLEDDEIKVNFDNERKAFLAEDVDIDDHAESLPDGFATFTGPDRAESMAHYTVASLVDAALELEAAQSGLERPKIIPNEQADALFLLASLSAEQPQEGLAQVKPHQTAPSSQVPSPVPSPMSSQMPSQVPSRVPSRAPSRAPYQVGTPATPVELQTQVSPMPTLSLASTPMSLEGAKTSPVQPADGPGDTAKPTSQEERMDICQQDDSDIPQTGNTAIPQEERNDVPDTYDTEDDHLRKARFDDAREQAEQIYIQSLQEQFAESDVDSAEEQDIILPNEQNSNSERRDDIVSQSQAQDSSEQLSNSIVQEKDRALPQRNDEAAPQNNGIQEDATPARGSTHRIMDILNNDNEVQLSKAPESLPEQPPTQEQVPPASPPRHESADLVPASTQDTLVAVDTPGQGPSSPWLPTIEDETALEPRPESRHSKSPAHPNQYWSSRNLSVSSDPTSPTDAPNPIGRLKSMLDKRTALEGEIARSGSQRNQGAPAGHESVDRPQSTPTLARPFSPAGRSSGENDTRRTSVGGYTVSPSVRPAPIATSPQDRRPSHTYYGHQHAHEQSASHMDHHRRMSGSHIPPPHSAGSPTQPYTPDYRRPGSNHSAHHSPYVPSNIHQHPPAQSSLPPRPPAAPAHSSVNYRFAYHDPAPPPPRAPYGPRASYPTPHPGPLPYTGASAYAPPPQYYQGGGYVPPPGSFQAPPPPPPAQTPYPPLSIKQYPGPPVIHPRPPPQSQMYTVQAPPPPHQHHVPPHPPVAGQPPHGARPSRHEAPKRRPYRSYHEPGTQFRTYQGPNSRPRRSG